MRVFECQATVFNRLTVETVDASFRLSGYSLRRVDSGDIGGEISTVRLQSSRG